MKKEIKKSLRKIEQVDPYMKEINNELTKQDLYREINSLVEPLLPSFQLIDKRGESKNNILDYSVNILTFRSITISLWLILSSIVSRKILPTK